MSESLFKPYAEICKILLVQCRRSEGSENRKEVDQDEHDQQERGLSISRYRDFAADVYFKAFFLLRKTFKA